MDSGKFKKYWLPLLVWSLLMLIITVTPGKDIEDISGGFGSIPQKSYVAHFAEFLIFSILLSRALHSSGQHSNSSVILLVIISSFAFSAFTEVLQIFVPGRYCELSDIFVNDAGAVVGLARTILLFLR